MRSLFGFLCACALVGTFPQSASAQASEEGTSAESSAEEVASPSEPAPEEPALELKLDDAGVEVVPSPPRTADGYRLEEMQRRVRNAKIGVGISGASVLVGGVLLAITLDEGLFPADPNREETARDDRIGIASLTLAVGGVVSLLTTGILLRVRKRKLQSHKRKLRELESMRPL